jgi:hypothetical protein
MSVFVDANKTFDITVYWQETNGRVETLPGKPAEGVKAESLTISFRRPDYATTRQIVVESTSLDTNGMPIINIPALRSTMLYALATKWDVKDEEGKNVDCTPQNIGKLEPALASAFVDRLYTEVAPSKGMF